jgi:hypothetical protein
VQHSAQVLDGTEQLVHAVVQIPLAVGKGGTEIEAAALERTGDVRAGLEDRIIDGPGLRGHQIGKHPDPIPTALIDDPLKLGLLPAFSGYLLYTVMISVLITLLSIMSNGSVLGSMLFHTMGNLSLGAMPLIFSKSGAVILLLILSAATAGFTYKNRNVILPLQYDSAIYNN